MTSDPEARCPFCDGVSDEALILDRGPVKAFYDAFPVSPGHALVVPRRHVERFADLTEAERHGLLDAVEPVRERIARDHGEGFDLNVGLNLGRHAGQTVPHLHLHLIPRRPGDVDDPTGGIRGVIPARRTYR